jgi:membrane protease YdiL (CAAX protease family)
MLLALSIFACKGKIISRNMFENDLGARPQKHPVINLIVILCMVGLGFIVVGPIIGFLVASIFFNGSMFELTEALQNPTNHPETKIPLYIMQGFATFIGLVIAPAIYLRQERRSLRDFFVQRRFGWLPVLITPAIVIIFMAVNSVFIEWNAEMNFPEFAKGFEQWARAREDTAAELTKVLTNFGSIGELVFAVIIIAVLPAIGEEIVFRGLIQNELYRGTRNVHVSIWIAAFLFSAIHFQFFGFVPRLLLGALFGYLYYWSGSLSFAIFAHFVNNAVSVIALYLYEQGKFTFDIESNESMPANVVILSALITGGLLYSFYKYFQDQKVALH